jgi:hypothetical protein
LQTHIGIPRAKLPSFLARGSVPINVITVATHIKKEKRKVVTITTTTTVTTTTTTEFIPECGGYRLPSLLYRSPRTYHQECPLLVIVSYYSAFPESVLRSLYDGVARLHGTPVSTATKTTTTTTTTTTKTIKTKTKDLERIETRRQTTADDTADCGDDSQHVHTIPGRTRKRRRGRGGCEM